MSRPRKLAAPGPPANPYTSTMPIASEMKRITVIGAGNIGRALIGGILKSGLADAGHVTATVRSAGRAQELSEEFSITACAGGNREAAQAADVVVLAVKPAALPRVLQEIRDVLRHDQILISLAAAVPIALIEKMIEKRMPIFRAMPNIPVVVQEGATALAWNGEGTAEQQRFVESIFRAVGAVCFVEEEMLHAVTALSGSGPAYVYMVIEALIEGGLKMGLSREIATRLTEQTVLGAAKLVRETGLHPAILKDQVITPGGTTISAIHELEKHGLRSMLISAIETATEVSRQRMQDLITRFGRES
ncbi:MAG TPA: pyrroline-5-carboxylate reductase [Bryobacteraceae bacterium]|nr:pyrroline-5-carboxylate reductase [Bryobacteraceae bacterium]